MSFSEINNRKEQLINMDVETLKALILGVKDEEELKRIFASVEQLYTINFIFPSMNEKNMHSVKYELLRRKGVIITDEFKRLVSFNTLKHSDLELELLYLRMIQSNEFCPEAIDKAELVALIAEVKQQLLQPEQQQHYSN